MEGSKWEGGRVGYLGGVVALVGGSSAGGGAEGAHMVHNLSDNINCLFGEGDSAWL